MIVRTLILILFFYFSTGNDGKSQQYDAEVISYTTRCEVEGHKLTQTDSVSILINSRSGETYTKVTVPYSKNEKISDIEGWIEDMDGHKVRKLSKSDITDKSAISDISLYEDNFKKEFQLKHNVYPYKITYRYTTTSKNFLCIAWWSPILYRKIPTRNASLTVLSPKGYPVIKSEHYVKQARKDSTDKIIRMQWEDDYQNPVNEEIFSQPEDVMPLVIVAPENFTYGIPGSLKSWENYGNWQTNLLEKLDELPPTEKQTVSDLIKGVSDQKEKVKILYHYMQDHTRYINVSIGIGGLKPYPAGYVAENKYGDCKALSNYMKALLSYAGIKSYYVNIQAGMQPRQLLNGFTGPQFNHAILMVPLGKDTIWLENTSNTNPFAYMGTFTQNRPALVIDGTHSHIVQMPALTKVNSLDVYRITYDLKINGAAKASLANTFRGYTYERFNQLNSNFNDYEKDNEIKEYMPFDNYEVVDWQLKKVNRDSSRIDLNATLTLYKFLKPLGQEYYFSLYPVAIPAFKDPKERKLEVNIPFPVYTSDTLVYHLPKGYGLKNEFIPETLDSKYGQYHISCKDEGDKITFIKTLEIYPGIYPLEEYSKLFEFVTSVKKADNLNILIKPTTKS